MNFYIWLRGVDLAKVPKVMLALEAQSHLLQTQEKRPGKSIVFDGSEATKTQEKGKEHRTEGGGSRPA